MSQLNMRPIGLTRPLPSAAGGGLSGSSSPLQPRMLGIARPPPDSRGLVANAGQAPAVSSSNKDALLLSTQSAGSSNGPVNTACRGSMQQRTTNSPRWAHTETDCDAANAFGGADNRSGRSPVQAVPALRNTSGSASQYSAPAKAAPNAPQQVLERRLAWLEEDFQVTERRLRDTFGLSSTPGSNGANENLQALCAKLEGELVEERRWREGVELQITRVEAMLSEERTSRGKALQTLSEELGSTIKQLVSRIDKGISTETQVMNERARKSEAALHDLIARVEEGLASGAKALDETLKATERNKFGQSTKNAGECKLDSSAGQSRSERPSLSNSITTDVRSAAIADATVSQQSHVDVARNEEKGMPSATAAATPGAAKLLEATEPLLKVLDKLQEENIRLRQRRDELAARAPRKSDPGGQKSRWSDGAVSRDSMLQSGVASPVSMINTMDCGTLVARAAMLETPDEGHSTNLARQLHDAAVGNGGEHQQLKAAVAVPAESVSSGIAVETTVLKSNTPMPNLGGSMRFPVETHAASRREPSEMRSVQVPVTAVGLPQGGTLSSTAAAGGDTLLRLPTKPVTGSVVAGARAIDPSRFQPRSTGSVAIANVRSASPPRVLAPQAGVNLLHHGPCQMNNDAGLVNPTPVLMPASNNGLRPVSGGYALGS